MMNILIPTDFSDNAWDALTYAIRLYDDIPCVFHILNSYETNPSRIPHTMHQFAARKVSEILAKESEENLEEILSHLNTNLLNDKHTYKGISKLGGFIPAIKNIVEKEHIDLIVMGTKGASGLKEVFMGSNTVNVVKNIDTCPVLCVPAKYVYEDLERLIFATDFKKQLNRYALTILIELQQIHNFNIQFVHVKKESKLSNVQEINRKLLTSFFSEDLTSYKEIESDATLSKALTTFAEHERVNLICLASYEHSFIQKLTHEPVIKKVGFHTQLPLIILHI